MGTILPYNIIYKIFRSLPAWSHKNFTCCCQFSEPTNKCQNDQLTKASQEDEDKKDDKTYGDILNILKNMNTQDFLTHCSDSLNNEKATAIKIMSLMQIPPGVDFQQTIEVLDWWSKLKNIEELQDQAYDEERVNLHGPDSAAAHFFLERQASVKLKDCKEWLIGGLPTMKRCDKGYFVNAERGERDYIVEAIDCKNFQDNALRYEGLQYLSKLNFLKHLSLENQIHIDAFCLDRIAGQNGDTLEYLDITGCNLDAGCIVALSKMKALKELVVTEPDSSDVKSDLMMLRKHRPGLTVRVMDNNRRHKQVSIRSAPRPVISHPRVSRGTTTNKTELKPPFE